MKCYTHTVDAVAICAYCGRALCGDCIQSQTASRMVCSNEYAAALLHAEQALQMILHRSAQSARASAFYCYVTAGLSAAAAIVAWFMLPSLFLILFTSGCAVVLLISGLWYGRATKNRNQ